MQVKHFMMKITVVEKSMQNVIYIYIVLNCENHHYQTIAMWYILNQKRLNPNVVEIVTHKYDM